LMGSPSQKQKKRACTRCAVCDTPPRGSGRARRLRKGIVREGRKERFSVKIMIKGRAPRGAAQ